MRKLIPHLRSIITATGDVCSTIIKVTLANAFPSQDLKTEYLFWGLVFCIVWRSILSFHLVRFCEMCTASQAFIGATGAEASFRKYRLLLSYF